MGTPAKPKWRRGVGNRQVRNGDVAAALTRKQRRLQAFDLKIFGASYARIAKELGISPKQARFDVERHCRELGVESSEEKRRIYTHRLEEAVVIENQAIASLRPLALGRGDAKVDIAASTAMAGHVRTLMRIVRELATINGVMLPVKVEHKHEGELEVKHTNAEDVLSRIARIAAARGAAGDRGESQPH